jgi:hypothetical protein
MASLLPGAPFPVTFTVDVREEIALGALSPPQALIGMTQWSLSKFRERQDRDSELDVPALPRRQVDNSVAVPLRCSVGVLKTVRRFLFTGRLGEHQQGTDEETDRALERERHRQRQHRGIRRPR